MNVLLLDTCTFLWIAANAPELTANARAFFSDPDNKVFLSTVSVWEIAVKHALGKLPLPDTPAIFVREQREQHHIDSLALDEGSTLQLHKLPKIHRDPFDRMLVCQAIEHDLIILTPDPMIKQYPVKTIW
ncbi:MAG TPA: type II toxin-antitoxin system VapC family toxin [Thioploca sp.]|nr:MAG: type II toxin-antitoxin system VapC family toxin [Gammaproteobacteria bacterium]HDN26546.1 type II toxin-antitoxin system VapC family toxin [Thioploca sp.]